jgi:hypothetical protein
VETVDNELSHWPIGADQTNPAEEVEATDNDEIESTPSDNHPQTDDPVTSFQVSSPPVPDPIITETSSSATHHTDAMPSELPKVDEDHEMSNAIVVAEPEVTESRHEEAGVPNTMNDDVSMVDVNVQEAGRTDEMRVIHMPVLPQLTVLDNH